ncbi:Hsp20/alpha crystallin family protein [Halalkalibacter urbisdiaboli]|uniref:Hsp20/alpha crystallin family protein n=1 Tax=Halalkalibacter urbisdiaboli TaxID=1960589 RepID=UPI000B43BF98|nr:Hsp20/alpha crystallin family protein [Halalkalibacter urbisdiaboli]
MSQFYFEPMTQHVGELAQSIPSNSMFDQTNHTLRTDIRETGNDVIVTFDIPGLERNEDVNIHIISNRTLSVSGTVNRSSSSEEGRYHRQERYVGTFHHSVTLPTLISDEGVKAFYKKGILEVRMQKATNESQKKIDIEFH